MQNPTAWLLFALFGLILFVMYVSLRRRWASPLVVSALGVLASVIVMTLTGLAQNNTIYQALFAGLLVGGLFSGGTVAMAAYFQSSEARQRAAQAAPPEEMEA
ncbi:MAG: hypothetical protein IT319_03600 [Anaerolineae bacterium]|nr:hypothetical protein [Anaerolineae bacterium]